MSFLTTGLEAIAVASETMAHMGTAVVADNPWCWLFTYDPEMPECLKENSVGTDEIIE